MAEVFFLELEDDGALWAEQPRGDDPAMLQMQLDRRVSKLVDADAVNTESLMKELQDELRGGNRRIAQMLEAAFRERRYEPEARGLALETLAAARIRWFEPQILDMVRSAIDAAEAPLQVAGIAAASDLSRSNQAALCRLVERAKNTLEPTSPVRLAAEAFLRKVTKFIAASRG